ncbi:MAG: hypothetical protein ACRD9S_18100 [Pyrinomonadaceae bacterium]
MFTSLMLTPDALEEVPAKSSLPWVWFGFFFVAAFLTEETLLFALELDPEVGMLVLILIALAGYIYWLFCVSRFHTILGEVSRNHYPISGAEAAWKHFIPFYNLVWVFRWPSTMSDYLNRRERVKMVSGNLLGAGLLVSLLTTRFFDGGVGLTGIFAIGMYISAKLRQHIELIRASSPDMLPPPPDPNWYPQTPAKANQPKLETAVSTELPPQAG